MYTSKFIPTFFVGESEKIIAKNVMVDKIKSRFVDETEYILGPNTE
jgi:hypothetical protein